VTLPLPLRNRLAELILDAFHDPRAREGLEAMTTVCADSGAFEHGRALPEAFPSDLFERRAGALTIKSGFGPHQAELCERAGRAWRLLRGRPLDLRDAPLDAALDGAAALFDAGLYFEVHELLEPYWIRADGSAREALQGLIQVAVGFHHLTGGNVSGARALLHDGCAKLIGRRLEGADLDGFAAEARRCLERIAPLGAAAAALFDWTAVPRFPVAARYGSSASAD